MEETLTHHHIKFKECTVETGEELEGIIKELKGVKSVKIDKEKGDAFVEYDLNRCMEADIEEAMVNAGAILDDGFMQKLKRGYIHYAEENDRENLRYQPRSCCEVDEEERKKNELK